MWWVLMMIQPPIPQAPTKKKASCSSCSSKAAPRKDIGGGVGVSRVLVVVKHRFGGTGGWLLALHPWSWWWPEKIKIAMSDSSRLKLTIWCRHQIQQRFFSQYFRYLFCTLRTWNSNLILGCRNAVWKHAVVHEYRTAWRFQTFFIFTTTWGDDPIWLIQMGWKPPTREAKHQVGWRPKPCWFWQLVLDLARRAVSDGTH